MIYIIYTFELEAKKLMMTIERVVNRSICAGSKRTYLDKNEASRFKRLCLFDESKVGLILNRKLILVYKERLNWTILTDCFALII